MEIVELSGRCLTLIMEIVELSGQCLTLSSSRIKSGPRSERLPANSRMRAPMKKGSNILGSNSPSGIRAASPRNFKGFKQFWLHLVQTARSPMKRNLFF